MNGSSRSSSARAVISSLPSKIQGKKQKPLQRHYIDKERYKFEAERAIRKPQADLQNVKPRKERLPHYPKETTIQYRLAAQKVLLYADRGLAVINKPNGLVSQPSLSEQVQELHSVILRVLLTSANSPA